MEFEVPVEIDATPEQVWDVLVDVETWPEWTPSMRKIERLEDGPFQVGSRARIWQPRMPSMIWRVTALDAGRSFTWVASRPGTKVVASHHLRPGPGGGTSVTLAIESSGLAVRLVAPMMASMMRRYVGLEAQGLKARAESRS